MKGAIQQCATAGIRVIVITGDNQLTANAICLDIGIFEKAGDATKRSFTGREFASMTLPKQIAMLTQPGGCVCSRAEPKHKQDMMQTFVAKTPNVDWKGKAVANKWLGIKLNQAVVIPPI